MPLYDYEFLDKDGNPTGDYIEVFQSMSDDALTNIDGLPVRKVFSTPAIYTGPRTVGSLAEKNTSRMIKEGDERIMKSENKAPFWRPDTKKPINFDGMNKKQIRRYIATGKK